MSDEEAVAQPLADGRIIIVPARGESQRDGVASDIYAGDTNIHAIYHRVDGSARWLLNVHDCLVCGAGISLSSYARQLGAACEEYKYVVHLSRKRVEEVWRLYRGTIDKRWIPVATAIIYFASHSAAYGADLVNGAVHAILQATYDEGQGSPVAPSGGASKTTSVRGPRYGTSNSSVSKGLAKQRARAVWDFLRMLNVPKTLGGQDPSSQREIETQDAVAPSFEFPGDEHTHYAHARARTWPRTRARACTRVCARKLALSLFLSFSLFLLLSLSLVLSLSYPTHSL
jgi:hypothetical protein